MAHCNQTCTTVFLTEAEIREAIRKAKEDKARFQGIGTPTRKEVIAAHFWERVLTVSPEFQINEDNARIVDLLIRYFSGDTSLHNDGVSLSKGIMLAGPVGCGKTTLLRSFRGIRLLEYGLVSCRELSIIWRQYNDKDAFFEDYAHKKEKHAWCLDDLGTEDPVSDYGIKINLVAELVQLRYSRGLLTHFTTNLTGDEIADMYGDRVKSRLREMVNFIPFDTGAIDRRK